MNTSNTSDRLLLSVDAGIRTGLALFNNQGQLVWYRSHNMGSISGLRRAVYPLLKSIDGLEYLIIEGGGPVAETWIHTAVKLGISTIKTDAGEWRRELLYDRQQRSGTKAKQTAVKMAMQFIKSSDAPGMNIPTHDAAEAILTGLWGCFKAGWIVRLPDLNK